MKQLLFISVLFLASCTNRNSVEEFKQYNRDAPNKVAHELTDFKAFQGDAVYLSRNNGYFEVHVPYVTSSIQHSEAYGVFKYNGKLMRIYAGQ